MGLPEDEQKRAQELRLQLNGGSDIERSKPELTQADEVGAASQVELMGCCNENGSSTCCQTPSVSEKKGDVGKKDLKLTAENKKSSKKQVSQNHSSKGTCTRRVCAMPTWFESWEREDTYAALAVIGAALSVAFAYNCYKQLK